MSTGNLRTVADEREFARTNLSDSLRTIRKLAEKADDLADELNNLGSKLREAEQDSRDALSTLSMTDEQLAASLREDGLLAETETL